mmetsp:Transcript_85/g.114  ORF Transcript_85/g.114 Transcript_85/m.114 type:complete len:245 (-) Transcript_85:603-1337(-)
MIVGRGTEVHIRRKKSLNFSRRNEGNYSMPKGESKIRMEGEGSVGWDSSAYNMILVEETEKFLDDYLENQSSKPFFSYMALGAVHLPHSPPDYYKDGTPVAGMHDTAHMDVLGEMDKIVGSVLEALEQRQLIDDTIIVFTSDNGGLGGQSLSQEYGHLSNGPLRGSKGQIWEGGHRIPMMIRWDNGPVPRNETRSKLVGLNDLFATLCDLADVEVPEGQGIDSISFKDYLVNEHAKSKRKWLGT